MNTVHWEVKHSSPPEAVRHCKKCGGKERFSSSGQFRVNAQQKTLDVWLIYRCTRCGTTWNREILSRVGAKSISGVLLQKYLDNDDETALACAGVCGKSGGEWHAPPCDIAGEEIAPTQSARIEIACDTLWEERVARILRQKLSLSAKEFDAMIEKDLVRMENGGDIKRAKLVPGGSVAVLLRATETD